MTFGMIACISEGRPFWILVHVDGCCTGLSTRASIENCLPCVPGVEKNARRYLQTKQRATTNVVRFQPAIATPVMDKPSSVRPCVVQYTLYAGNRIPRTDSSTYADQPKRTSQDPSLQHHFNCKRTKLDGAWPTNSCLTILCYRRTIQLA